MGRQESPVEDHLIACVTDAGGFSRKVVYQGRTGSPDRWNLFPLGRILIVETKALDKPLRPDQKIECKLLRSLGFWVAKADSRQQVDAIMCSFHSDTLRKFNEKFPLT